MRGNPRSFEQSLRASVKNQRERAAVEVVELAALVAQAKALGDDVVERACQVALDAQKRRFEQLA